MLIKILKSNQGLTLIEMMITIAILGILMVMGQQAYYAWQQRVYINNATQELKSSIVQIQQKAAASANASSWGIHLESDRYTIFSGDIYLSTNPKNVTHTLTGISIVNPATSLSDGTSGYSPDLVFTKFNGQTLNYGTITLQANSDTTVTHVISISAIGVIQ